MKGSRWVELLTVVLALKWMRSRWGGGEGFDTGGCHFGGILKAGPHIRDVIQSKLVWNSKAKALLFCPKFVYSVVSLNVGSRAVKPEPKRTEKEEWLSLVCLQRTKNCQRSSNGYVGMRDSFQKNSKMWMCAISISQTTVSNWILIWACG